MIILKIFPDLKKIEILTSDEIIVTGEIKKLH